MSAAERAFHDTGCAIKNAEPGQMFGKPCFKINGKAFVCFFEECMVFKLTGKAHEEALKLNGAKLFDPSGKGRAMKEWVQVPFAHQREWNKLCNAALKYLTEQLSDK
jgi:hypothetical protein